VECLDDESIREEAKGALEEVSRALQEEYGFTRVVLDKWIDGVLTQTNNPTIGDSVIRSAADPIRKLQQDDRLIGPLLLCKRNGLAAPHLIRAIAAAFHFNVESDKTSLELQEFIHKNGIRKSISHFSGLKQEDSAIIEQIVEAYETLPTEYEFRKKAQEAYNLGFEYEKEYHGCGQCVLAAVTVVLDVFEPKLFMAATGLCGGIGLNNDGTCAVLIGGALAFGLFYARTRDRFDDDKDAKNKNFELVQALRGRFIKEYGTITCGEIHKLKI
jgi:hypothetical protein